MRIVGFVFKEIKYRSLNFVLSVLAVAVAAALFILTSAVLKSTDLRTDDIVSGKEKETRAEMTKLEDQMRKSMKGLGFNIYIFPEGQDMGEVHDKGFASKTMPEEYVTKLANSKIVTVNHLLPTLTQKIEWPEYKRTIVLIGVRGEVPIAHASPKKPMLDPVAKGKLVIGYELHRSLGLKPGDKVKLLGRDFEIAECYPERGSKDDITVWMNLVECQELLDKVGKINAILALECNCATLDRLGEIRKEIGAILPGTTIIEKGSEALARAEARIAAGKTAKRQIEVVRSQRGELQAKREALAGFLIPLIGAICLAGIGLLTFLNVRERILEVGIFSAIGIKSSGILWLFMAKAIVTGLAGGLLGAAIAAAVVKVFGVRFFDGYGVDILISVRQLIGVVIAMPVFSSAAAWLPSFWASQRDPAEVLKDE